MKPIHTSTHGGRGNRSPLGGVHNAPQTPTQGVKPTVPSNTEISQEMLAGIASKAAAGVE